MYRQKLNEKTIRDNKQNVPLSYENYVALDWSIKNMAIARLIPKMIEPKVIDVPSDIKELKLYLKNLNGSS